MTYGTETVSF